MVEIIKQQGFKISTVIEKGGFGRTRFYELNQSCGFSSTEIARIAELINLDTRQIIKKLSE